MTQGAPVMTERANMPRSRLSDLAIPEQWRNHTPPAAQAGRERLNVQENET
jgi:hypothetical protein